MKENKKKAGSTSTASFNFSPPSQNEEEVENTCNVECLVKNIKCPLTLQNYSNTIKTCCNDNEVISVQELKEGIKIIKTAINIKPRDAFVNNYFR